MTDDEIIKALVRCTSIHTSTTCLDCPYSAKQSPIVHFGEKYCKDVLLRQSLTLITCQKRELDNLKRDTIPKLQYSLERANKYGIDTDKENQQLRAEIERLKSSIKEANEYLSEGDFAKGIALVIKLVKEMTEGV